MVSTEKNMFMYFNQNMLVNMIKDSWKLISLSHTNYYVWYISPCSIHGMFHGTIMHILSWSYVLRIIIFRCLILCLAIL